MEPISSPCLASLNAMHWLCCSSKCMGMDLMLPEYFGDKLRASPQSVGDLQVRHVHAGNEKRHSHRSEEDENRRAALARDGIPQRADGQIRLSGAVARLGNDAFQNRQKFRARSRWRDAWAQACDHAEVEAAFAGAFPVDQGHGPPHLGWREWPDE